MHSLYVTHIHAGFIIQRENITLIYLHDTYDSDPGVCDRKL